MNFNVLTEPWIPARLPDGSIREYGVLELLEHAHELVEITDAMPNYEFGMYRFLFVFLMDAYRPKRQRDIRNLLESGHFDMDVIQTYVEECNRNGERFDLLDEWHPFLQQATGWEENTEEKSPANLNPALPSGNNHVHFDHTVEADSVMSPSEAVKALCAINLFSAAGVQGYPSTPSGAPPVYTIVQGNNLFETLSFGMVPSQLLDRYDDPPAVWRYNGAIQAKNKTASTSLLFGLMFPCRRIRLCSLKDGLVTGILFEQGMNYENYDAWTDPYVTYTEGKKGRQNLKPNMDKENWRNLGTILNTDNGAPYVITQAVGFDTLQVLTLITYSAVTNQMNYLDLQRGNYCVPVSFVESPILFQFLCSLLENVETEGDRLSKSIYILQKDLGSTEGASAAERTRTINRFYFRCKKTFFEFIDRTLKEDDIASLSEEWQHMIRTVRWLEYNTFVDRLGNSSRMMLEAERVKKQNRRREERI